MLLIIKMLFTVVIGYKLLILVFNAPSMLDNFEKSFWSLNNLTTNCSISFSSISSFGSNILNGGQFAGGAFMGMFGGAFMGMSGGAFMGMSGGAFMGISFNLGLLVFGSTFGSYFGSFFESLAGIN